MRALTICFCLFWSFYISGQVSDTITFYSEAFDTQRQIVVITPDDAKYYSDLVQLPVIYVLDGQHHWFVNPVLSTIKYLKYTHELPDAIIVVIPHDNRNLECAIPSQPGDILPLHTFITQDIEKQLETYNPDKYRMIIGHSFSASFALYSALLSPDFYSFVMAHSPLDRLTYLVESLANHNSIQPSQIAISIGGPDFDKDKFHRIVYETAKGQHPQYFDQILTYESEESAHNAVPILATPFFLSKHFYSFSRRYGRIAKVDMEYKLESPPGSPEAEWEKVLKASRLGPIFYPPEIGEINGLASRYLAGEFIDQALKIYEEGLKYHPHYYDFHINLYALYAEVNQEKAKYHLLKSLELIHKYEQDDVDYEYLVEEIEEELRNNGWLDR